MRRTTVLLLLLLSFLRAEYKGMNNLQLHLSNQFDKKLGMIDTKSGNKATLTFEHFGKFDLGDHFFFVDQFEGSFLDGSIRRTYIEYWPRVRVASFENSFVKNFYVAGQYNQYVKKNKDLQAYLYGVSVDLKVPYFKHFEMNLYQRNSNLEDNQPQLTFRYASFLPSGWSFTGYFDLTEDNMLTFNQLTYDIGKFVDTKKLYAGIELLSYNQRGIKSRNVPQLVIKKIW